MDKIICLVGPSGSGKTTIAKELEREGYNIIKSYTTRPPRGENEWGHTFMKLGEEWGKVIIDEKLVGFENFYPVEDKRYQNIDIDDMIAFFDDYSKDEIYFATKEQYRGKGTSIYVVDPGGVKQVKKNVKDAEVVTIFLMADEATRLERMKDERGYYVTVDRINKDVEIFSKCKCDYVVDANRSIEEVITDIKEFIRGSNNATL